MEPAGVTHLEPKHLFEGFISVFVAFDFEWLTASSSVAVESCLTRLLKDSSERAKREKERYIESGRESIYLQEFGVITRTHSA